MIRRVCALVLIYLVFGATVLFPAALQIDMLLSQVRTNAGGSLAGGHVHFYSAGTTTNKTVWTDYAKTTPAANPYTLDANGTALLYGDGIYRIVIHTATGVTAFDRDNIRYEDVSGAVTRITSLIGDGSGNISGFDNLTLTGSIAGDNTGTFTGYPVSGSLLVDNTVTSAKILDNSIASSKILDNTIQRGKIQDNAVTSDKMGATGTPSSTTAFFGDNSWKSISNPAIASYKALKITTPADNQSVTITAEKVVVTDNADIPRLLSTVSLTVDLGVSGANGLDNGSIAANTGYFLYVIDNGATTAGLASTSATSPTLPSGYTYKTLVGWCTTDNTATPFNIAEFTQIDDEYVWKTNKTVVSNVAPGGGTLTANLAAGGADTYAIVPPNVTKIIRGVIVQDAGGISYLNPETMTGSVTDSYVSANLNTAGNSTPFTMPLIESQKFYHISNNNKSIYISGFILKR